ncbi:hypothetical protein [Nocardioides rubriscoriae]|uniref:hypothetical protein n=1 Tax=Nocardioides rubriscoriae TaxID=642762 RepID=UPI0011DFD2C6|nr:hypothetical protein [Nocardioides rubriscoriae]
MTQSSVPSSGSRSAWQTPSPASALLPGGSLMFVGLWALTDGGPLPLAWLMVTVGLAFLVMGAVAKGVAWGLALHASGQD